MKMAMDTDFPQDPIDYDPPDADDFAGEDISSSDDELSYDESEDFIDNQTENELDSIFSEKLSSPELDDLSDEIKDVSSDDQYVYEPDDYSQYDSYTAIVSEGEAELPEASIEDQQEKSELDTIFEDSLQNYKDEEPEQELLDVSSSTDQEFQGDILIDDSSLSDVSESTYEQTDKNLETDHELDSDEDLVHELLSEYQSDDSLGEDEDITDNGGSGYLVPHERIGQYSVKGNLTEAQEKQLVDEYLREKEEASRESSSDEFALGDNLLEPLGSDDTSLSDELQDDLPSDEVDESEIAEKANISPPDEESLDDDLSNIDETVDNDQDVIRPEYQETNNAVDDWVNDQPELDSDISSVSDEFDATLDADGLLPGEAPHTSAPEIDQIIELEFPPESIDDSSISETLEPYETFSNEKHVAAAEVHPIGTIDSVSFSDGVPEDVHETVKDVIDDIPPQHLAGVCDCEIRLDNEARPTRRDREKSFCLMAA